MIVCPDPENCQPYGEHYQHHQGRGVLVPEPTRCSPDAAENGCTVNAETCTCTYLRGCSEDEGGCCFCVHMDIYHPCPTFGFGCGPGCDCCTPYQQRQVFRHDSALRLTGGSTPNPTEATAQNAPSPGLTETGE